MSVKKKNKAHTDLRSLETDFPSLLTPDGQFIVGEYKLMHYFMALFFLAFLPQFTVPDSPLAPQLVVLGCICVALNTLVDVLAVFGADRMLKSSTARAARAKFLNRVSGGTMVALGVFLATARRGA